MENIKFDKRALSEVYKVLIMLEKEKLNKIPTEIVDGIQKNRDEDYEVDIEELEENMLPDTEKILAALYAYYLANQEEKSTIFQMIELEKKQKYGSGDIFKREKTDLIISKKANTEIVPVKDNIFARIKNWFKKIFRR